MQKSVSSVPEASVYPPADRLEYGQLEAGIIYEDSQVEYVTGKDSIDMTFQIEKTGNYRVYVTNPNAYTMNVVGFYVR